MKRRNPEYPYEIVIRPKVSVRLSQILFMVVLIEVLLFSIPSITFNIIYPEYSETIFSDILFIIVLVASPFPVIYYYRERSKFLKNVFCEKCGIEIPAPVSDEEALEVTNTNYPQVVGCPILYYCLNCKIYWHIDDNVEYYK